MATTVDVIDPSAERLLALTGLGATTALGERLHSIHAIGSLAHGGFAPLASDVDVALILEGPLRDGDEAAIEELDEALRQSAAPLAERLSLFWGDLATLRGEGGGRLPALDRADLLMHGRRLDGAPLPAGIAPPSTDELVAATAEFALERLDTPQLARQLARPETLAQADVRTLTKYVLFPVRFIWTAETGRVGAVDAAVTHHAATRSGPAVGLVERALAWRTAPPTPDGMLDVLDHAPILYADFLDSYVERLSPRGSSQLIEGLRDWRSRLPS